jgi:predicted nucleic acid-binding protein
VTRILADTGLLVALFHPADRLAPSARSYLREHRHPLVTVAPVIVETCFFLSSAEKVQLLDWAQRGGVAVVETPVDAYPEIAAIVARYADRDIDLADAALIWLANASGQHRILTLDERDFSAYRLKRGKRFDPVKWT